MCLTLVYLYLLKTLVHTQCIQQNTLGIVDQKNDIVHVGNLRVAVFKV